MKWYPTDLGTPIPIFRGREHRAMSIGQEAATEQWAVRLICHQKKEVFYHHINLAERWAMSNADTECRVND